MGKEFFDDCRIGDCATSPGRTITEADVVTFAALSGDWSPIHTDAQYAEATVFGERIAHGVLSLAVATGLMFRLGDRVLPRRLATLVGIDRLRFPAPVRLGDTIHLDEGIVDLRPMGREVGLVTVRLRLINQNGEAVMTARFTATAARRPEE